jgi:hypothetical protein
MNTEEKETAQEPLLRLEPRKESDPMTNHLLPEPRESNSLTTRKEPIMTNETTGDSPASRMGSAAIAGRNYTQANAVGVRP